MEIDLLSGAYQFRYEDFNGQRSINWYDILPTKENDPEKNKHRYAKFPTPGLKKFATITGTKGRGIYNCRDLSTDRCFAVIDDTLYEILADGTATNRGTLSAGVGSTGPVYFTNDSSNNMMIIDFFSTSTYSDGRHFVTNNGSLAGYNYDLSTNTLTAISDVDFPSDAADIGRLYFSELNDPTSWIGDGVLTPTFKADPVLNAIAFREEVFAFGPRTIEFYLNDGTTPFVRQERTTIYYGVLAPHSVREFHDGLFFLGRSVQGQPLVGFLNSRYQLEPVSTPSISWQLSKAETLQDSEGMVQYTQDGHIFYYLHVPALETTFVYDMMTNRWHERQSKRPYPDADGQAYYGMFRGNYNTNFKGLNLFTDRYSGNILVEDFKLFTEDDETIQRVIRSLTMTGDYEHIDFSDLEIDVNSGYGATTGQGSDPVIMVRLSKDGGKTYGKTFYTNVGKLGEYRQRVKLNGLGSARHWVFEIKLTDPVDVALFGAVAHGEKSE